MGNAGEVCPWAAKAPKVAFYRKLCCAENRGSDNMPPRALASALAMVLEDWGVFTVGDFADVLDGMDGVEGACKHFANRIRSDELVVAVRATVAADAMSAAWASAELRLLSSELRATEDSVAALSARAACGAKAVADVLILDEELSTARAELTSSRRAADTHKQALQSIKTELAAVKLQLAAAVRARHEAEQEVAAAKALGLALLDAKAAQCAAETARAAAEDALADALVAQEALASRAEERVALLTEKLSARTGQVDVATQTSPPASPELPATVNNYRIRHRQSTAPCGVTFATAAPPHIQPPPPGAQEPVPHSLSQVPLSPSSLPPRLNQPRRLRITYSHSDSDEDYT